MLPAPKFENILQHALRNDGSACCILLAPPFTKVGESEVIPRIGYLDHRSATFVHFYCAGYGGYWRKDDVPDMQDIGEVTYKNSTMIPWAFSQKFYGEFVDDLEEVTKWSYSGGAELIFLGPKVDFSNTLILYVDKMIEDGAILSSAELFETIIRYCRNASGDPSAYSFSDIQGGKEMKSAALESLLSILPNPVKGLWEKGNHYAVKNIAV